MTKQLLGNKKNLSQKMSAILLGIVFSALLLELGLRAGGLLFVSLQEYSNRIAIHKKGTYRIMCVGESTTARKYPLFLEEILNQRKIGIQFSVVDKGVIGTNTSGILRAIEENVNTYKPDMVVAMMGCNDKYILYYKDIPRVNSKLFRYCRLYRFMWLMYTNIIKKVKKESFRELEKQGKDLKEHHVFRSAEDSEVKKTFSAEQSLKKDLELSFENDSAYFRLGEFYKVRNKYAQAEELFKKAIELNPENDNAHLALGKIYAMIGKGLEAEKLLRKAVELNPKNVSALYTLADLLRSEEKSAEAEGLFKKILELNPRHDLALKGLGKMYRAQATVLYRKSIESPKNKEVYAEYLQEFSQAEQSFKKATELNPLDTWGWVGLVALYRDQGDLSKAVEVAKKFLQMNPDNEWGYRALESLYSEMDEIELVQEYKERREELGLNEYSAITINNYHKLKEILDKRGIRLVCMQYPMRSVEPLKKIFEGERGAVFVDNEHVFKDALKRASYLEYFTDSFGGDFGHGTPKGNRLLAENAAYVILKEVFGK